MTTPTPKINLTELLADREAGTGGEWEADGITVSKTGDRLEPSICYVGEYDGWGEIVDSRFSPADRRRIARLPDLEAAYIEAVELLAIADDAIAEMFRYYDGGETRGSYDGRPERDTLRRVGYKLRAAAHAQSERSA